MNTGKIIKLTDGTVIEAKMNFGTIYYLEQIGGAKLAQKIDRDEKKNKALDKDKMNFAAKLIYALVRSNGRKVTFDEALELVPADPTELLEIVEQYQKEVEKIQDEFYHIYAQNDLQELKRFHKELDLIAEGYRAQAITDEL